MVRADELWTTESLLNGVKLDLLFRDINFVTKEDTKLHYRGSCIFCKNKDCSLKFWKDSKCFECSICGEQGDFRAFIKNSYGESFLGESVILIAERHRVLPQFPFGKYTDLNGNEYLVNGLFLMSVSQQWYLSYLNLGGDLKPELVSLRDFIQPYNTGNGFVDKYRLVHKV